MACANLFKNSGVPQKNITMVDRKGVIYRGRENLNQWKSSHAIDTQDRTLSDAIKDADIESIFNAVKSGMKVKKMKVTELWQIAPKYDAKGLREQYVSGKLYRLGDIVENLNTGLIGKIIRRGTNHLICVTEENHMFKSWIRDVMEYTEVKMSSRMRDKTHPNYLVGTSGYRKNVMDKMGVKKITNFNIKEFINKYKLVK